MTSYDDVSKARNLHAKSLEDYQQAANRLAKAEYDYDIVRAAATKIERDSKTPISIIDRLVNGNKDVAMAKRKVTLCKSVLKVADARVQATYRDWCIAKDYEDRDWRQAGMGGYGA